MYYTEPNIFCQPIKIKFDFRNKNIFVFVMKNIFVFLLILIDEKTNNIRSIKT